LNVAVRSYAAYPAIVSTSDDRTAIGMTAGGQDCTVVNWMTSDLARIVYMADTTVAQRHQCRVAYPKDRRRLRIDLDAMAVAVDQRFVHHLKHQCAGTAQASKPARNDAGSRLRPMNTIRLVRTSSGFQSR